MGGAAGGAVCCDAKLIEVLKKDMADAYRCRLIAAPWPANSHFNVVNQFLIIHSALKPNVQHPHNGVFAGLIHSATENISAARISK